jgi:hypothetical protein
MTLAAVDEMTGILAAPVFGGGLPPDAERLLYEAAHSYSEADVALAHLREARRIAPNHVAVLIGAPARGPGDRPDLSYPRRH